MRALPVLLLVALLLPVPISAQATDPLLEDPAGDVQMNLAVDTGTAAPSGLGAQADLRSLSMMEGRNAIGVQVGVESLDQTGQVSLEINVRFTYGGRDMGLQFARFDLSSSDFVARLRQYDEGSGFGYAVAEIPVTVDEAAKTVHAEMPRGLLIGIQGDTPRPGTALEDIRVTSQFNGFFYTGGDEASVSFSDTMGTDAPARLDIQYGLEQTGHARLSSTTPFRASNGEATTFVYEIDATNLGEERDLFSFKVIGAPDNWEVTLPTQDLRLDGGETDTIPVVVRTAFVHAHGSATAFVLEMHSGTDSGSVGRIELGVRYPTVPQPAGHHDTLWLHSVAAGTDAFTLLSFTLNEALVGAGTQDLVTMNTMEDDETDDAVPVKGNWCETADNTTLPFSPVFCWPTYLVPGLEMGIDFDLSREGHIEFPVHSLIQAPHRIEGQLLWQGPSENPDVFDPFGFYRETIVLAELVGEWTDVPLNGQAVLSARIVVTPEADLIAFNEGAALLLDIRVAADRPDNFFLGPKADKPEILPGGSLTLPLFEYEDPVGDVFDDGGFVALHADVQEKLVNPGKTVVFNVTVENLSPRSETFVARLVGSNEAWGTVLGSSRISLAGNATTRVSVSVAVPEDAVDGDRADLLLEVASTKDLDGRGLIRLVATVDTDADHPDEATTAEGLDKVPGKKSPGLPAPTLLLAVAALALLLRRR